MKRFIFNDNGTLSDYSTELVDYHSGTGLVNYVLTEDSIYIGSELPFNSLYFDVSAANDQASVVSVSYYNGTTFESMVDVQDETASSGVTLAQSGHIIWTPNRDSRWQRLSNTEDLAALADVTIYDLYWLKIDFSASLAVTTALSFIGPKFCEDADLTGEHVLFANSTFKSNYESGKTDWEKEIILASRLIVTDLKKKQAIVSGDQLLERRILTDACVSKTAELIFTNLGDDYNNDRDNARAEYKARLDLPNFSADKDGDAMLDASEKGVKLGGLYR